MRILLQAISARSALCFLSLRSQTKPKWFTFLGLRLWVNAFPCCVCVWAVNKAMGADKELGFGAMSEWWMWMDLRNPGHLRWPDCTCMKQIHIKNGYRLRVVSGHGHIWAFIDLCYMPTFYFWMYKSVSEMHSDWMRHVMKRGGLWLVTKVDGNQHNKSNICWYSECWLNIHPQPQVGLVALDSVASRTTSPYFLLLFLAHPTGPGSHLCRETPNAGQKSSGCPL